MNLRDFSFSPPARGGVGGGGRYSPAQLIFFTSIILNIVLWVIVLLTFPKSSPNAILHYTAGIGIDFIGQGWQIITLPSIGVLLIVVNVILARYIKKVSDNAFWILWISMPLLQVLLLATYGILLGLNK